VQGRLRASRLEAALELVFAGGRPFEERTDGVELRRFRPVRGAGDRELALREVVTRAHERERLERLRGRAHADGRRRLAAESTTSPSRTAATSTTCSDSTIPPRSTATSAQVPRRGAYVPELPEVEAWRRALDGPLQRTPIEQAGPAHIATLKTFDPPLDALEGRTLAGARRRRSACSSRPTTASSCCSFT